MKITITIEDATQDDRDEMNKLFLAFKSQELISIKKIGPGQQEWTLACVGATRTFLVCIVYINNTVNNNTVNYLSTVNVNGIQTQLEKEKSRGTSATNRTIVNDNKPKEVPMELLPLRLVLKQEVQDFITFWNEHMWLPKVRGTDRQCKEIRIALSRPLFAQSYKEGVAEIAKSKFLRGGISRDGTRFHIDLDWFLDPDNFDKIIEGKYRDTDKKEQHHEKKFDTEKL